MKAISLDLRLRAVALYRELGSFAEVGRRLQVRARWVGDMVRRAEHGGSLEPDYDSCGNRCKLGVEQENRLRQWLDEENGLTLHELQDKLAEVGFVVSHGTVANTLKRMGLTHKKRRPSPRNANVPTSRSGAPAGLRKR